MKDMSRTADRIFWKLSHQRLTVLFICTATDWWIQFRWHMWKQICAND